LPHQIARLAIELAGEHAAQRVLDNDVITKLATDRRGAPKTDLGADGERRIVERDRRTARNRARRRSLVDQLRVQPAALLVRKRDTHAQLIPRAVACSGAAQLDELREGARLTAERGAKHDLATPRARRVGVEMKARIRARTVAKHNAGGRRAIDADLDTNVVEVAEVRNCRHVLNHTQLIRAIRRTQCARSARHFAQRVVTHAPRARHRERRVGGVAVVWRKGKVTRLTIDRRNVAARSPRQLRATHAARGDQKKCCRQEKTHCSSTGGLEFECLQCRSQVGSRNCLLFSLAEIEGKSKSKGPRFVLEPDVRCMNFDRLYGLSNFRTIRNEGLFYVDKTPFIAKVENHASSLLFCRPPRFGQIAVSQHSGELL
jgi:hypothetical protein